MWAYHENVPIAVTAWEAALAAYDNVVNTSTDLADDVLPAIQVETTSTVSVQAEPIATSSQKYCGLRTCAGYREGTQPRGKRCPG